MQSLAMPKKVVVTADHHQWKTAYNSIDITAPTTGLYKMAPCLRRPIHDPAAWDLNAERENLTHSDSASESEDGDDELSDDDIDVTDI